jgi:hypothetical protein
MACFMLLPHSAGSCEMSWEGCDLQQDSSLPLRQALRSYGQRALAS